MKNITSCFFFLISLSLIPSLSYSNDISDFKINGTVKGSSGTKAYLVDIGIFYRLIDNGVILDSCEIVNDTFEFEGKVEFPIFCAIQIPELTKAYKIFILEHGNIEINGHIDKLHLSSVASDGKENDLWNLRNQGISSVEDQLNFISEYPSSLVSLHLLDILLFGSKVDFSVANKSYHTLSDHLKRSPSGEIVRKRIDQIQSINWKTLPTYVGEDIYGNQINFNDFAGKYVIIDFWATWCQPCIEDMPKMVEISKNYKDSIQVISVSLDRDVDLCKRKIEKLGMQWRHICTGDASRGKLPLLFNVQSVPRVVIYDENLNLVFDSLNSDEKYDDFLRKKIKEI